MKTNIICLLICFAIASVFYISLNLYKEKNKEDLESKARLEEVENTIEYFYSENSDGMDLEKDSQFLQTLIFKINANDIFEKDIFDLYLSQKDNSNQQRRTDEKIEGLIEKNNKLIEEWNKTHDSDMQLKINQTEYKKRRFLGKKRSD